MQCLGFSQPLMLRSFLRMLLLVRFCFSNGQMKYLFHQVSTLSKKERNMDGAAKAKFNFTAQTPMEVSFLKGRNVLNVKGRNILNVTKSKMAYSCSVTQVNLLFSHDASTRTGSKAG